MDDDQDLARSEGRAAQPGRWVARFPATMHRASLVAALLSVSVATLTPAVLAVDEPAASATAEGAAESISVAERLGIDAAPTGPGPSVEERVLLQQLAASRAERAAEQNSAARVQAEAERISQAERVAAEARAVAEAAAAAAAAAAADVEAVMPIQGARLTSPFGPRWGTLHGGVDLAAPMMTPEYAAMDGIVLQAGAASGFGLAVYIQHENGDVTVYGHMEQILVEAGQVVQAGETIALVGNRGQSTGPHLHFEVRIGGMSGEPVDPLAYLRERGVSG